MSRSAQQADRLIREIQTLLEFVDAHPDRSGVGGLSEAELEHLVGLDVRIGLLAKALALCLPAAPPTGPLHFHYLSYTHLRYFITGLGWKLLPTQQWDTEMRAVLEHVKSAANRKQPALEQYVTLEQAAAVVNKSKRTLEKYKSQREDALPPPDVEGGGGRADEWNWSTLRPWLERVFGRPLPQWFPSLRFPRS
jgi:hypothetical protein